MVVTKCLTVYSMGKFYSELLTDDIRKLVTESMIYEGIVTVSIQHTTSALLLMEHEAGILVDLEVALNEVVAKSNGFYHHKRLVDTNGEAHVFSALFNRTITVALHDGSMMLGEFQDIVFWDFQEIPKARTVSISLIGTAA